MAVLGYVLVVMVLVLFFWLLPMILILRSKKTSGAEKFLWLLLVLFVSWFAWILYLFLAPIGVKQ